MTIGEPKRDAFFTPVEHGSAPRGSAESPNAGSPVTSARRDCLLTEDLFAAICGEYAAGSAG